MIRKKRLTEVPTDLTEIERDLLWHMQNGYQLETDSLGGHLLLRRTKDKEVIRPASANRNTLKALQQRGLIAPAKTEAPLTIVWRANNKPAKERKS
jgi:hypothetical protein